MSQPTVSHCTSPSTPVPLCREVGGPQRPHSNGRFAVTTVGLSIVASLALAILAPRHTHPVIGPIPAPNLALIATPPEISQSAVLDNIGPPDEPLPLPGGRLIARPAPIQPLHAEFALVFTAGGKSYLHIADAGELASVPDHRQPQLVREDAFPVAVVAPVAPADLPASIRAWADHTVVVDSRCRTQVKGFAVVSQLISYWDFPVAGDDPQDHHDNTRGDQEQTLTDYIFTEGQQVIAAELAGCDGTYASIATFTPAAAEAVTDHPAMAAALSALQSSRRGRRAAQAWRDNDLPGTLWQRGEIVVSGLRHPHTGELWVAVQVTGDIQCGGLEINLLGLYRGHDDGTVTPVTVTALDNIGIIDSFVDVDGDGRFEMIAPSLWGADTLYLDPNGKPLRTLHIPFYGCQC